MHASPCIFGLSFFEKTNSQYRKLQSCFGGNIIIHPLTEYLSNDINQCGATSCHTWNIFIYDQYFKSNLTGREYKTISSDQLSCGSTNVLYGIHCAHCGLVYVGETGRSLTSMVIDQPLKRRTKLTPQTLPSTRSFCG